MILDIILFIAGAALVIFGADWLVDGASAVARKAKLSEYVIGATIVGIGTSMPEFVVSTFSAIKGSADMAVGNVAGSNLFNTLFILGVTALILPLNFTRSNLRSDIPLCIGVSVLFMVFASTPLTEGLMSRGIIDRYECLVLLIAFTAYLWHCFRQGPDENEEQNGNQKSMAIWKMIAMVLIGIGALVGGGQLFVDSAIKIAKALNVSETIIATTLMAGGTSLPELAVCVVAAAKGREQMAIGNIIGSNIANILLIIGFSALIRPLHIDITNMSSIIMVVVSSILLFLTALPFKTHKLSRWKGAIMVAIYIAYIVYIV